jgi:hypothetical protein
LEKVRGGRKVNDADKQQHVDIAALSAAIVAVFVALFVVPGNYGIMNLVIGITLDLIIFAYVFRQTRGIMQMLAIAAALSFASIPIYGFAWETGIIGYRQGKDKMLGYVFTTNPEDYWNCTKNEADGRYNDKCTREGDPNSRVPDLYLAGTWLGGAAVWAVIDCLYQRRRRKRAMYVSESSVLRPPLDIRLSGSLTLNEPRHGPGSRTTFTPASPSSPP